jgi:8-oxo-dGTP pyrophosphatase MutT (NUDIX family)
LAAIDRIGKRDMTTSPCVTLSSRIAYENRWTRLREDRIRHADGSEGIYGVVERSDFVVVVPWQDGQVTLVEQYRYPVGARIWEFPMGMWEQAPGTDPVVLAAAELREETGLIAGHMPGRCSRGPGTAPNAATSSWRRTWRKVPRIGRQPSRTWFAAASV